ncbi:MAG: hypothetical protein U5L96_05780 [Owenweeksia sp.]|nr:hypothetical protein [Owenweeksia sp.]
MGQSVAGEPFYIIDPDNPEPYSDPATGKERYNLIPLKNGSGTVIPSIGLIVNF